MNMATATKPQLNTAELEQKVKEMYGEVAPNPHGKFHFEMGRALAERLGYPGDELLGALGGLCGVSRAWASARAPRLVLMDFDPRQTDTQNILGTVLRRGFDARLVGM